jgi:flagellar motor protein MotB
MRRITVTGTPVLFLVLGTIAPTYPHQGQQGQEAKPPTQEQQKPDKQQQDKDKQKQDEKKQGQQHTQQQQQQEQKKKQQQHTQQQQQQQQQGARPSQRVQRVQRGEQRTVWQQHRARNWQAEHRTWQQRGGYNGYRIPEDRYRRYFGRSHRFRIYGFPLVMFGNYPCFQYNGLWFCMVDPWPQYWSNNWYENDDLYISYSRDGYYLYNGRYPQNQLAITVYLNLN